MLRLKLIHAGKRGPRWHHFDLRVRCFLPLFSWVSVIPYHLYGPEGIIQKSYKWNNRCYSGNCVICAPNIFGIWSTLIRSSIPTMARAFKKITFPHFQFSFCTNVTVCQFLWYKVFFQNEIKNSSLKSRLYMNILHYSFHVHLHFRISTGKNFPSTSPSLPERASSYVSQNSWRRNLRLPFSFHVSQIESNLYICYFSANFLMLAKWLTLNFPTSDIQSLRLTKLMCRRLFKMTAFQDEMTS